MKKNKFNLLKNPHPGVILQEEFLNPLGMTQCELAKYIGLSTASVTRILKGQQPVTADTAIRLSKLFDTSAKVWVRLQADYDLEEVERKGISIVIKKIGKRKLVNRSRMTRLSRV